MTIFWTRAGRQTTPLINAAEGAAGGAAGSCVWVLRLVARLQGMHSGGAQRVQLQATVGGHWGRCGRWGRR